MKMVKTHANEMPEDRATWFGYMPPDSKLQEQVVQLYQEEHTLFAENGCESETFSEMATTVSGKENSECTNPKEENSENAQKEKTDGPEGETCEDTGEEKCDYQGQEYSKHTRVEVTPEDQEEGHS